MKKILVSWVVVLAINCIGVQAGEIMVSWSSNGLLTAKGMEPGSTGVVEAVSNLGETFTNAAGFFDASYVVDSNGIMQVAIPMFFRVIGTPARMVLIPAGTNSGTDPDFGAYSLTNESAFYMDATEVTKAQWDEVYNWAVMNGYSFINAGSGKGMDHPVQTVNWYDCVKWCNARSEMKGRTPCYTVSSNVYRTGQSVPDCDLDTVGYRLPTSDEWEYAARGGLSSQRFPWGDTISHALANYDADDYVLYDESSLAGQHPDYDDGGYPYTSPVGTFAANGYGLYDMAGNVWEWCSDWYLNYVGWFRVMRGGCWSDSVVFARCGSVRRESPGYSGSYVGFRAVLPAD